MLEWILCRFRNKTVPVITCDADHNRYFKIAGDLAFPHFELAGVPRTGPATPKRQADLRRAVVLFESIVKYAPTNWSAYWLMGKSYQALGEAFNSFKAFKNAYALQKGNADVAREYMMACLETGAIQDAVEAAEHAVSLEPRDPGLLANLALAYTIMGRASEALCKAEEALRIDPKDVITQTLKQRIDEVISGRRPQPRSLKEFSKR